MSVRASTSSTASTCTRATADAPRARSACAWQAPPATARSTQSGPSVSIRVFRTTVAQFRCQHLVESLRGDAAVEIADLPPPFREADLIGAPGFGDENGVPIAHRSKSVSKNDQVWRPPSLSPPSTSRTEISGRFLASL